MPTEVILPRVDMDMATGKVSKWFVKENAKVEKGQVIFEIETDKAAMEIEAPVSGILRDVTGEEGQEVPVGSIVAMIYGENEAYAGPAKVAGGPVQAAPGAPIDIPTAADAPAEPASPAPAVTTREPVTADSHGVRATPLARRFAREQGIELSQLRGSGPRGRIQHSDVLEHVSSQGAATEARPAARSACRVPAATSAARETSALNRVWLRQGSGTPIVLIHGFGSDLNSWRPLLSSMPADRSILGIDLPGHGRSPLSGESTLDDLAASIIDTLLSEGVESLHLIGHSLGSAVAATVAAQSQLDIRSLMLLSPAGLGPDMNGAFISGFLRATSEASLAPWVRELAFDERALGASFVSATLRARTNELTQSQEQIAGSLFPDGTQSFSIRHLLENFDWPVKVVYGTEDRIIPARHAAGLPGNVAVHLFPATGHMPQIEQRQAIGRLAAELARLG
ncbi:acetoin dehydrogenase dihydrolipoyllysine-residue acetyltransferase subunit [Microvirga sp. ACRRW]|uniref:acetoin dehydrogenase dihydrolipoyllysine-residue acetyltransferase subunit n=1 Tax=Microvirga sp. ACRRW TaxID=2918205 RepID=UPI001EF71DDD|nr:acetoin dehydrogenase dihydrolipoyllysine-residue acetyltransferase subunit [Microvirga sp. ACRRW]MCG7393744.1 acetoin dehydrogenase dihydrolipoyllysine-residue acetyltransferase subunit [Microvirga sp. ACRRW]